MKQMNGKTKQKKNFQKVFSAHFSKFYQSPIPPSTFLCTSKYCLLKGLALAAAVSLHWTQRKPPRIRLPGVAQGIISLAKLVHTSCSVPLTPQKPVTFPKENSELKEDSGEKTQCSKAESFGPTELIRWGILMTISPTSNQFYTVWLSSSVRSFLYSRVNINTYVNSRPLNRECIW